MKGKIILGLVWLSALAVIVMASQGERKESTSFYGIAETGEIAINSENAVEIKKIHVVPGQKIDKDVLILELSRPELSIRINEISHQLEELKVKKIIEDSAIKSQIKQLEAQEASTKSEIEYRIRQIETQHDINKGLMSELKSIDNAKGTTQSSDFNNPMDLKIESLNKELEMARNLIQIKIKLLKYELNSPENAYSIQLESLEKQLKLLKEEERNLLIYSQISGVIGSVNCKEGEKISPFTPICTLHTQSPSYIIGYIHENVYNKVAGGSRLKIASLADRNNSTLGEVVGVGSRIVEYPARLRRRPEYQLWGREIQIRIPQGNRFLLGEKVLISPPGLDEKSRWAWLKNYFKKENPVIGTNSQ